MHLHLRIFPRIFNLLLNVMNDKVQFTESTQKLFPRDRFFSLENVVSTGLWEMQLHTGAEDFGNVIFRYSELTSQYHIDASIDVYHT